MKGKLGLFIVLLSILINSIVLISGWSDYISTAVEFNQTVGYALENDYTNPLTYSASGPLGDGLYILKNGTITTPNGTSAFNQYLSFNASAPPRLLFTENPNLDTVDDYLYISDGQVIFWYDINFTPALVSSISGNSLVNLIGKNLTILGSDYFFVSAQNTSDEIELTLLEGLQTHILTYGTTETYTMFSGEELETTMLTSNHTDLVNLSINGLNYTDLQAGDIEILPNNTYLVVWDITNTTVNLSLGKNRLIITDSNISDENDEGTLKVNGAIINDVEINIKGTRTSNYFNLTGISYKFYADDDYYLGTGEGLREQISQPQGMITDKWNLTFEGLNSPDPYDSAEYSYVNFAPTFNATGTQNYALSFTNSLSEQFSSIPFISYYDNFRYGYDTYNLIFLEPYSGTPTGADNETFISLEDWFIVSDTEGGRTSQSTATTVLHYDSIDTGDETVTFVDHTDSLEMNIMASYTGTPGANATGELVIKGVSHNFWIGNVSADPEKNYSIAMDLDGSGAIDEGEVKLVVGIEGGGILDLGETNNLTGLNSTTLSFVSMAETNRFLKDGESTTCGLPGQSYDVETVFISGGDPNCADIPAVKFMIDGTAYLNAMEVEETRNLSEAQPSLVNKSIRVNEILTNQLEGLVEFYLLDSDSGDYINDSLEDGETKTYALNGTEIEVTASFIASRKNNTAVISVNGVLTSSLSENEAETLDNNVTVLVSEVLTNSREGLVTFSLNTSLGGNMDNDTLRDLETKTYTLNGQDFEVTAVFITSSCSDLDSKAILSVNGEYSNGLQMNESQTVSDVDILVTDILTNDREGMISFNLLKYGDIQIGDTLRDDETKTYTINGTDYEITATFISSGSDAGSQTVFSVNGEQSRALEVGESQTFDDVTVIVDEILNNMREGIVVLNITDGLDTLSNLFEPDVMQEYTFSGYYYGINVDFISQGPDNSSTAKLSVDELLTHELGIGESEGIGLGDDRIYVDNVLTNQREGFVQFTLERILHNDTFLIMSNTTLKTLDIRTANFSFQNGVMGFYTSLDGSYDFAKNLYGTLFQVYHENDNVTQLEIFYPLWAVVYGNANVLESVPLSIDASVSNTSITDNNFTISATPTTSNFQSIGYEIVNKENNSIVWTSGTSTEREFEMTFNGTYLPVGNWTFIANVTDEFGQSASDNYNFTSLPAFKVNLLSSSSASEHIAGSDIIFYFEVLSKGYPYVKARMNLTSGNDTFDVDYASIGNQTAISVVSPYSNFSGAESFSLPSISQASVPSYVNYRTGIYYKNLTRLYITPYSGLRVATYSGNYGWAVFNSSSSTTIISGGGNGTLNVTFLAEEEEDGGGSNGGGGGGATTPSNPSATQTWTQVSSGAATIMKVSNDDYGIKEITITVNNPVKDMTISIEKLAGKPAEVTKNVSGKVFRYLSISKKNLVDDNVKGTIKIKFQVSQSWLLNNKINSSNIVLKRFSSSEWNDLKTTLLSTDTKYAYYEAETPGLSYFAIGEKALTPTTPPPVATPAETTVDASTGQQPPTEQTEAAGNETAKETPTPGEESANPKPVLPFVIIMIVVIIVVGLGGIYASRKRKKAIAADSSKDSDASAKKKQKTNDLVINSKVSIPSDEVKNAEKYVEQQLKNGKKNEEIKQELVSRGWNPTAVDVIVHDVHVIDENRGKLNQFAQKCLERGVSLEEIKKTLLNIGWGENVVEMVLDNFR